MVPDRTLFDHGIGSGDTLNTAVRSMDRTTTMVYLSSPTHVVLCLDRIGTNRVRVKWVSSETGVSIEAGDYETGNELAGRTFPMRQRVSFTTPDF
jgi:hypothetical protein